MRPVLLALLLLFTIPSARAEAPRVVADIPPVASLVATVMAGAGEPLSLTQGESPHHHAMRPGQASALSRAGLVVLVGGGLAPWLDRAVDSLSSGARVLTLTAVPGTRLLPRREGAALGSHDDHESHDDHDGHDEEHDDHDEAHEEGHKDGHEEAHDDHDHGEGGIDPHAWLDPVNAALWLDEIASALSTLDPARAELYTRNAAQGRAALSALTEEITRMLAPVQARPFAVAHDAWQYYEARFGLNASAALRDGDDTRPGPARMAEAKALLKDEAVGCIFTEPGTRAPKAGAARVVTLDPLGADLPPGPGQYAAMMRGLAAGIAGCLDPTS